MITIKNIVFKLLFLFTSFFIFNLEEIDSNSDKRILYDLNNIYEEKYYKLYFKNINSYDLDKLKYDYNLKIINYIIDEKKYYANDSEQLIKTYTKDMNLEKKLFYELNGIRIDAINVICEVYKVIEFENKDLIY